MNAPAIQSAAHAAHGSPAALMQEFSLVLYAGAALIFVLVMCLLLLAVFGGPRAVGRRSWLWLGGLTFPVVTLSALTAYSLAVGAAISDMGAHGPLRALLDRVSGSARALRMKSAAAGDVPVRIDIVAHRWWWEVRYPHPSDPGRWVTLANELHLPAGHAAQLALGTPDVIHSFWVPSLAGKVDVVPGRVTRLVLRAGETGVFRGQCAEFCGPQHALMALYAVVTPAADFDAWLLAQAGPATVPSDPLLRAGYEAFLRGDCGRCHTVRGTAAAGSGGPDLTHVGSRRSLAAGTLRNHIGTMAGWIADPQALKPGNLMPASRAFSGEELRAVSAWLGSLQ